MARPEHHDLYSRARAVQSHAKYVVKDIDAGELVSAEAHAVLLVQQAEEIRQTLKQINDRAREGAAS